MTVNRMVLGARGDGTFGLRLSKPGFNVLTATDDDLLLSITQFSEQLILLGSTVSLPATVPFGYASSPFVLLTSTNLTLNVVTSVDADGKGSSTTTVSGMFARPYPQCGNGAASVQAAVSKTSMTITGGGSVATYAVYRRTVH